MPIHTTTQHLSFLLLLLLLFLLQQSGTSQPLSTRGRWVVDAASGRRVKLHCVNWAAHMPAVLAEGLDKQPLQGIAMRAAALGFNCVRLTYATYLFTRDQYENLTVGESLQELRLTAAAEGVGRNNPEMVGMGVREAYDEVVKAIGDAGMVVVLDNHVSKPQWCCASDDGNGFFGDFYFDVDEWLQGLDVMARRFRGRAQVVGMSMRNELRGRNQSDAAWYTNIARGASKIHEANPDVLVIVSGLHYDTDLSFLAQQPLNSTYDSKLVFEAHWYSFGLRREWANQSPNRICSKTSRSFDDRVGFLLDSEGGGTPLFVSEFGVDQRGWNKADNRYLSCFLAFVAERDLDWALWTLQGSYYLRNGIQQLREPYGVLDSSWNQAKNPNFQQRFRLVQDLLQDPDSSTTTYQIMYHPQSGKCVYVDERNNVLLNSCETRSRWNYGDNGTAVRLIGTTQCLQADGKGLPVKLSTECNDGKTAWTTVSSTEMQIATSDAAGKLLCLEGNSTSTEILTTECLCQQNYTCSQNLEVQWFKFVPSNIP